MTRYYRRSAPSRSRDRAGNLPDHPVTAGRRRPCNRIRPTRCFLLHCRRIRRAIDHAVEGTGDVPIKSAMLGLSETPGSIDGMLTLLVPGTETGKTPNELSVVAVKRMVSAPAGVAETQNKVATTPVTTILAMPRNGHLHDGNPLLNDRADAECLEAHGSKSSSRSEVLGRRIKEQSPILAEASPRPPCAEQPALREEVQRNAIVQRGSVGLAQVLPVPGAKPTNSPSIARASRAVRSEPFSTSPFATS